MRVDEAMTVDVVSVHPDDRARRAADLLTHRGIGGLPVVEDDGALVGVVTELDLLRAVRGGPDLRGLRVADVMDRRPLYVEPETGLATAAALMDEWQVRRLPVCAGGRLIGIVTRGDILRTVLHGGAPPRPQPPVPCGSGRACACVSAAYGYTMIATGGSR